MGGGFVEKGVGVVGEGAGELTEGLQLVVGDEELGGGEAMDLVTKEVEVGEFGEGEFACGVVGAGETVTELFSGADLAGGGEVVVLGVVEEGEVVDGGGGDDLCNLAFDDLTGFGFGCLFGEGDAFASFDEFGDVSSGGMVWDAGHGDVVAFGEGDVEDGGGNLGVFEEHFVKVTQPVEEEDVVREGATDGLVLGHHGGEFFGGGHGRVVRSTQSRRGR